MIQLKVAMLAGVAAMVVGGAVGAKLHDALVHQPHLSDDAEAYARINAARERMTAAAMRIGLARRDALDARQAEIRTVTQTILKEVPRYVETTVQCPANGPGSDAPLRVAVADVSVGFGLLHNYAARGVPPPAAPAAGIDLAAPSGIGVPGVAQTIVSNYGVCHAAIAEAGAWRAWHRDDFLPWWDAADAAMRAAGRR
ncbi:MAG: hypothetical protein CVT77_09460 [Alphaproteobacteria bacterium HGW-Alphaproteobacteria-16]|nr:MAG: hypothetical protein CVT77_09460 [Alphaproteobacteria bacterium HGW-Alphaproteobacteria-16]